MLQISSKLPNIGTTIFTTMSALAVENNALNLSQGFPSFNAHPDLLKLVNEAMQKGHNQYAPMPGILALREQIAEKTENTYRVKYDPVHEITITTGATEALYCAITAIVNPGDEVILFEPCYDSYVPSIRLNGGIPKYITLTPDNNFKIDWLLVKKKINSKTKAIIINTPQNPVGTVLTKHDLESLANLVKNTNIMLIADEVYEHITFDSLLHTSLAQIPELWERTFVCCSFGKTFHTTGWKIGYCLAPKELSMEFRKIHQWITFSVNTPIQFALAEFMKNEAHFLELSAFYQQKRDLFLSYLKGSKFKYSPAQGTFFQCLNYENITQENDFELAVRLTKEIKVASIPLSVFYKNLNDYKILRFCFAKDDEMLKIAADRLCML
jgi:methionine transaminase